MSVHLVGGGRELELAALVYGGFVSRACLRAAAGGRTIPQIGVIVVGKQESLAEGVAWFAAAMARCGVVDVLAATAAEEPTGPLGLADGEPVDDSWFGSLDGLLVGGGLTPAYDSVLRPHGAAIRGAVGDGLPYAGFSAGAAVAATRALLGGWRLGPVPVTHEDNAEDLDGLTVVDGLGLVPMTVEVHTAQWGTLSRLVAAVDTGLTTGGIAIDENTVAILDAASNTTAPTQDVVTGPDRAHLQVHGAGQVWLVDGAGGRVHVERRPPE